MHHGSENEGSQVVRLWDYESVKASTPISALVVNFDQQLDASKGLQINPVIDRLIPRMVEGGILLLHDVFNCNGKHAALAFAPQRELSSSFACD